MAKVLCGGTCMQLYIYVWLLYGIHFNRPDIILFLLFLTHHNKQLFYAKAGRFGCSICICKHQHPSVYHQKNMYNTTVYIKVYLIEYMDNIYPSSYVVNYIHYTFLFATHTDTIRV